jgi:nitrate reductase alpha subunit
MPRYTPTELTEFASAALRVAGVPRLDADVAGHVVEQLRSGKLKFAIEDPDAPQNWPRCLTLWRANLLGSSAKGAAVADSFWAMCGEVAKKERRKE